MQQNGNQENGESNSGTQSATELKREQTLAILRTKREEVHFLLPVYQALVIVLSRMRQYDFTG